MRIDAHHHFWRYDAAEFDWIDDSMAKIRRDFLPNDLRAAAATTGVQAAVSVQARQSLTETDWLLTLAARDEFIRGVVGWVDLRSVELPAHLERFARHPKLKGVRHVVQAEPDDAFILGDAFNRGVAALRAHRLVYDVLIFARHLPNATRFVDRHPEQVFVLDHIAKPDIRGGEITTWRTNLRELARRPNVYCKVSGVVTEADHRTWTETQIRPYLDAALEAFGPRRLMAGSDWPVCLVACDYARWWRILETWSTPWSDDERARFFGLTACEAYSL